MLHTRSDWSVVQMRDMRADYVQLVRWVHAAGRDVSPRGLATSELTDVTLVFDNPYAVMLPVLVGRAVSTKLAAVEALGLIAGLACPGLVTRAVPTFGDVLIDPTDVARGAYGPRAWNSLRHAVAALRDDPTSRRAVVTLWDAHDPGSGKDVPCTLSIQFMVRDRRLDMTVAMRSQDVWRGAATDMFVFTQLRNTVARALDVAPGRYVHHVASLHLYRSDVPKVAGLTHPSVTDGLPIDVRPPTGLRWSRALVAPVARVDAWEHVSRMAARLLIAAERRVELSDELDDLYGLPLVRHNYWYARQMVALGASWPRSAASRTTTRSVGT